MILQLCRCYNCPIKYPCKIGFSEEIDFVFLPYVIKIIC